MLHDTSFFSRTLPFHGFIEFFDLEYLEIVESGLTEIPEFSEWPLVTLKEIVLTDNPKLERIGEGAFEISNLAKVTIQGVSSDFTIETSGLYILSQNAESLTLPFAENLKFNEDAFGLGFGSHPWTELNIWTNDFPENVFRPLLNRFMDNGVTSK